MAEKKKNLLKNLFRIILFLIILCMLAVIGFAGGVYLKYIDMQKIVSELKLNQQPLFVKYFPQLITNFEPVELEAEKKGQQPEPEVLPKEIASTVNAGKKSLPVADKKTVSNDNAITQLKVISKQEEAKRISRLARLYSNMKPDEAVNILSQLNDSIVLAILNKMEEEQVSKVLTMFEPKRAARLTEFMLKGTVPD